jgi:membrane fusion protein (multidrug efflux system)
MTSNSKLLRLFVPVVLLISACGGDASNEGGEGAGQAATYPVIEIDARETTIFSSYPATIEGQQNIEIRPKVEGFIERIFVDEGATVKKGQALFLINAPQFEQEVRSAKAAVQIAQANVNSAQMEVNKVRPLVEKNIISNYQLETALFNLESQEAQLAQAKATLANASTNVGYTRITSPVDGVIGTLPYKIGSLVSSNTPLPLTTVSNVSNIYAYFSINEKQVLEIAGRFNGPSTIDKLAAMPPVSLILANGTEYQHPGRIETTGGLINTATGSISVRATFPNPGNLIRSGSSGSVKIPITIDSAIVIPQKSTYEIQGKKFVYIVADDGTISSKAIVVMDNDDGQFYIVEEGLSKGDRVVMEGLATLRDGVTIQPAPVNTDSLYRSVNADPSDRNEAN